MQDKGNTETLNSLATYHRGTESTLNSVANRLGRNVGVENKVAAKTAEA